MIGSSFGASVPLGVSPGRCANTTGGGIHRFSDRHSCWVCMPHQGGGVVQPVPPAVLVPHEHAHP